MKTEYNSTAFTPEEVKKGLHLDLLKTLLDYNNKSDDHYNDIHITTDGYCTIVEWTDRPCNNEYGGSFQFVDEECEIMKWVHLPDKTSELIPAADDEKDFIEDWLKDHPGYHQTEYGHWYHDDDVKEYQEMKEKLKNEKTEEEN